MILNFVSFENTSRVDVTATNQFSLSERTRELLDGLQDDVRATAFYKALEDTPNAEVAARRNRVVDTLEEFSARSGRFSYEVVDPDLEPGRVAAYFGATACRLRQRDRGHREPGRPTSTTRCSPRMSPSPSWSRTW